MSHSIAATASPLTRWIRTNLFSSWFNVILTVFSATLIVWVSWTLIDWALIRATWSGDSGAACRGEGKGACWPFVWAKFPQFIYGRYPLELRWRVNLTAIIGLAALIPLLIPSVPWKRGNAVFLLFIYPVLSYFLLHGGLGLEIVETVFWGGLLLTLVISITGIAAAMPLGVMLALGRRSKMPAVRLFSIIFIEFWRGVPLITVLFMASVMLPLFLPEGVNFDKLLRCLIGVALFAAAYMAETVRGGLQAIPRGQYEAAQAMGLSYTKMMLLIILPQALKLVIPGIVNSMVSLIKDTTLVLIIGLFDLLGIIQLNAQSDPNWASPYTANTGYLVAAIIFWIICFSIARYSLFVERRLGTEGPRLGDE